MHDLSVLSKSPETFGEAEYIVETVDYSVHISSRQALGPKSRPESAVIAFHRYLSPQNCPVPTFQILVLDFTITKV
jgi:hypothetical protein